MELVLLRHGIPVDPEHWGGSENMRPLTPTGEAQARATLQALHLSGRLNVDGIWCSPLTRCQQTAHLAAAILGLSVITTSALASGMNLFRSLPKTHGSPDKWPARLLCVGHAPDLGYLISDLVGDKNSSYSLGRAGTAYLTGQFATGQMKLEWLLAADEVVRL